MLALAVAGCGSSSPAHPKDSGADTHIDAPADSGGGDAPVDSGSGDAPSDLGGSDAAAQSFTVGGTVAGLAGSGLVLTDGAGHQIAVTVSGTFSFATSIPAGTSVAVAVSQQPSAPAQVCTVVGGVIASLTHDVTDIAVTCVTSVFTVAGTVSGLTGTGLVLQNNGADDLPVTADGAFVFPSAVSSGATFTVSVKTQPTAPAQTCQVAGGAGTIGGANVTSVAITCGVNVYTIGGTTSGLVGTGLVLQNNAGDDLSITANGAFAFATPVHSGEAFTVAIKSQPTAPVQTCVVTQGTGTAATGNVTTIGVTCATNTYVVGGMVTGLSGSGLVLQDNLEDNLNVTGAGPFTFAKAVASGALYGVTVLTQPSSPSQTCTVTSGGGTVGAAAVADVSVSCTTNSYSIGGTVVGLAGTGLKLQNEGGDDLTITASGAFTFATSQASGMPFAVTIAAQPTAPDQTCTLSGATGNVGAAAVTSVIVNCDTNQHVVGGTVAGLAGTGLTLSLNGGTPQAVSGNGAFAFAATLPSGGTYQVAVASQPTAPAQTCVVSSGTGPIASDDITSVAVNCTTNSYAVGGTVTGVVGTGLTLTNNGGGAIAIAADGSFAFPAKVPSGGSYVVAAATQPAGPTQTCVVTNASGGIAGADVTNVVVTCTTNKYAVGGTLSGLAGTVVIHNGASDSLTLTANGPFAFPTSVASGGTYSVSVTTQPATPTQVCTVTAGSGAVTSAAVTDVVISCVTSRYKLGGAVVGLTGGGLVLQDNAGDDLTVSAGATGFTFGTSVPSGATYAVTIKTQPSAPTQTCVVVGGSGAVGAADVSSVTVNCSTNSYVVGGVVTGLYGAGLVLQNNGGHDVAISGSGSFAFTPPLLSGDSYAVTVKTNPTTPWQTCTVTDGTGIVGNANVVAHVSCSSMGFPVSVTVTGVAGTGLVLQDNAGDNLAVPSDGTYQFATLVRSGLTYAVTVLSQPITPWQTCTVNMPSGAIAGAGVTLSVSCTTNTYKIGGTVTGLLGSGLVLRNNGGDDEPISADGSFTFATPVASGAPYAVTVAASPTGPDQTCSIINDTGSPNVLDVTNVKVVCTNSVVCASVDEGQTVALACPTGETVGAITFASYGTPNGTCGAFTRSTCDATNTVSIMSAACVGQQSCSVDATNTVFGDPCSGTFKRLWVQYSCH